MVNEDSIVLVLQGIFSLKIVHLVPRVPLLKRRQRRETLGMRLEKERKGKELYLSV